MRGRMILKLPMKLSPVRFFPDLMTYLSSKRNSTYLESPTQRCQPWGNFPKNWKFGEIKHLWGIGEFSGKFENPWYLIKYSSMMVKIKVFSIILR